MCRVIYSFLILSTISSIYCNRPRAYRFSSHLRYTAYKDYKAYVSRLVYVRNIIAIHTAQV